MPKTAPNKMIDLSIQRSTQKIAFLKNEWWHSFKELMEDGEFFYRDLRNAEDQCEIYYLKDGEQNLFRLNDDPDKPKHIGEWELKEFLFAKAYNGELFVRATGEEYPRKIGITVDGKCGVSDYTIQGIKSADKPEHPGFWAMLIYAISDGKYYAKEVEGYRRQLRQHKYAENMSKGFEEIAKKYNSDYKEGEAKFLENKRKEKEEQLEKEKRTKAEAQQKRRDREEERQNQDPAKKELLGKMGVNKGAYLDLCMELDCYDNLQNNRKQLMTPEYPAERRLVDEPKTGELKGTQMFGFYRPSTRGRMKYSGMTEEQLATLAMFACCTPRASDKRRAYLYGKYKERANGEEGAMKDIADVSLAAVDRCQHRIDFRHLMEDVMLRKDGEISGDMRALMFYGRQIMGDCVHEAFDDVPVPRHLGTLLRNAFEECTILFRSSPELNQEAVSYGLLAEELLQIWDSNIKVAPLAKDQYLNEKIVEPVRGIAQMAKIRIKGLQAQKKLLEAGAKGEHLENAEALLADVQLMGIVAADHRSCHKNHRESREFRRAQKAVEEKADSQILFGAMEHNRDCRSLKTYGQDESFPSSTINLKLGRDAQMYSRLRRCFIDSPEIKKIAGKTPQEIADYVRDADADVGDFEKTNIEIMKRWKSEQGEERQTQQKQQKQHARSKQHSTGGNSHREQKAAAKKA
ncbi:MAG: hypothetical protein Q4B50_02085 [Bacillota bacterium]|nr:hypothetical protein [Bacillota bacterium]